ncbi:MAG: lytic transglycosylase domain-containing protein [Pseudomonadota bacterium]
MKHAKGTAAADPDLKLLFRQLGVQLFFSAKRGWRRYLKKAALFIAIALPFWLFVSVDVSFNDRQKIASRVMALGGLGLTPFFVYSETPPLLAMADRAALKHGIDPMLFRALVNQESQWNPSAVSPKGAAGLTQLMPATAKEACGLEGNDRFDPEKNLDCGALYLAKQIRRFESVHLALAAYNSGPTRVAKLGRIPRIPETQNYVSKIMTSWSMSGGSS